MEAFNHHVALVLEVLRLRLRLGFGSLGALGPGCDGGFSGRLVFLLWRLFPLGGRSGLGPLLPLCSPFPHLRRCPRSSSLHREI